MADKKFFSIGLLVLTGAIIMLTACDNLADKEPGNEKPPLSNAKVQLFRLNDVELLDGPFKTSCELNSATLLKYDVDRLLAPFLIEAGLTPKGALYTNWSGLDGHVGGHYLSALAMTWAASGNETIKDRMDYMVSELKRCQDRNGNGYVGGVPNGAALWNNIRQGNISAINSYWVPWYNIHKIFAGLRDSWVYGNSYLGLEMFLKLCDWGLGVIENLNDTQMEEMLDTEFGGINEVYADAFQITSDTRYLEAAKRFSHKYLLDSMANEDDILNGMHANTQVPKAVGYAKVAQYSKDQWFTKAAGFFWDRVVNYRSVVFGGNSRNERFRDPLENYLFLEWVQGPETCNTYNMLKLTEILFQMESKAKYADFYERALYNHILSSQNPQTGGYVYFTPLRPEHYRVYSTADMDMWCCVGTGMESHSKYGAFIYAYNNDALYVNLFASSRVTWKSKGVTLTQTTNFPDEETSTLTVNVTKPVRFPLRIRYPWWIGQDGMQVVAGGKNYAANSSPDSFIEIDRTWNDGDTVQIIMPMDIYVEGIENLSGVIAVMRGPILLCAATDTEDNLRMYGDGSRMGHEANGLQISPDNSPVIIGEPEEIIDKLKAMQPIDGGFLVPGLTTAGDMVLKPFFRLHDSRYIMYWMAMTEEEYEYLKTGDPNNSEELLIANRTVDRVMPGEQQSEAGHKLQISGYNSTGSLNGEFYRNTREGGWFQYEMDTNGETSLSLMVRYWGNEIGNRTFDIYIGGTLLTTENTSGKWHKDNFINVEYTIPAAMIQGKSVIVVRFQTSGSNQTGGIYSVRLLK